MSDLWWDYICPEMADISPLKKAQSELIALGVDYKDAGIILARVHKSYVDGAFKAAKRYEKEKIENV